MNLKVLYRGTPKSTLESGEIHSALFGQALQTTSPDYVSIDADGTGLQFSGSSNMMDSFTVGVYVNTNPAKTGNIIWSEVVKHNFVYPTKLYDAKYYRLMPHVQGISTTLACTNNTGQYHYPLPVPIPDDLLNSWVHIAFGYNSSSKILKAYLNGNFAKEIGFSYWEANGINGGYASKICTNFLIMYSSKCNNPYRF